MNDNADSRHETREDDDTFLRPGHSPDILRKLRRGHWPVGDEIDLHGMTADEAAAATAQFIADARQDGARCVRVIHGKGLRSGPRGPVLKHAVNTWLRKTEAVLAFASARQVDGGTGAVYVLLAR